MIVRPLMVRIYIVEAILKMKCTSVNKLIKLDDEKDPDWWI